MEGTAKVGVLGIDIMIPLTFLITTRFLGLISNLGLKMGEFVKVRGAKTAVLNRISEKEDVMDVSLYLLPFINLENIKYIRERRNRDTYNPYSFSEIRGKLES